MREEGWAGEEEGGEGGRAGREKSGESGQRTGMVFRGDLAEIKLEGLAPSTPRKKVYV